MDVSPEAIKQLIQKAKQGDTSAFTLVYQQYFLPVYRYILRRVGNKQTAEDLSQTVFLKIFTSQSDFEIQNVNPLAYFFVTARNIIIDFIKKNPLLFPLDAAEHHPHPQQLEKEFFQKESVTQILASLEPNEQKILRMKFFEGYTTDEIGVRLQITSANVRQIQCRALKKLRDRFSYE